MISFVELEEVNHGMMLYFSEAVVDRSTTDKVEAISSLDTLIAFDRLLPL